MLNLTIKSMEKKINAKPEDYTQNVDIRNVEQEVVKTDKYDIFTLVTKGKKVFIAIGNNIVTHETFNRVEQAKKYIDKKPWELILNTVAIMQSMLAQMEQQTNKK